MTENPPFLQNPYVVGKPASPTYFIGRSSEIATAFDQILSRSNLAIWGGSGMGKSSFLETLASPQAWRFRGYDPSRAITVLLSCLNVTPFTGQNFWREVFLVLKDQLGNDPDIQAEVIELIDRGETTKDCLRAVLRSIGKKDKFLVLLIDDYDKALRTHENYTEQDIAVFLSDCRNLASHAKERQYLSMVVASMRRLNETKDLPLDGSPWYNHYLFQPLKPFTETEAAALLGGLPMTPALREGIRDVADGNPALLQTAGYLLFRELRADRTPDVDAFARDFQRAAEHYFQDIWNFSNEIEQTLLMLLALTHLNGRLLNKHYDLGDINIIFSQKERELIDLDERGVVIYHTHNGKRHYRFASSLMEWWVIKEIENSDEEALSNRQRVFLNLMSHRQAENVTKAIRWLWQHKEEVPPILTWLGKLSAALPTGLIQG